MMMNQLSHAETLHYIDIGISIHKADVVSLATPYEAKHYFAAGYAKVLFDAGLFLVENDKAAISKFVSTAINAEGVGQTITVNGVVFATSAEPSGVSIRTASGRLVSLIEAKGLDAPIKAFLTDDFEVYGQTLLRHARMGAKQEQAYLIGSFYPTLLLVAAIGLATQVEPQAATVA